MGFFAYPCKKVQSRIKPHAVKLFWILALSLQSSVLLGQVEELPRGKPLARSGDK